MIEYRRRYNITTASTQEPPPTHRRVNRVVGIAARYELDDMMAVDVPVARGPTVPSIDNEFKKYTSEVSPVGTNMIKFWDVS